MARWIRSLRWRLQVWHAVILFLVVLVFGGLLHWEITRAQWDAVDEELVTAARVIEGALRFVPPPILDSVAQDIGLPPGPRFPPPHRQPSPGRQGDAANSPNRPLRERYGDVSTEPQSVLSGEKTRSRSRIDWGETPRRPMPDSAEEWELYVRLPDSLPQQLGRDETPTYFAVWNADGRLMKRSVDDLSVTQPPDIARWRAGRDRYVPVRRGKYREVYVSGPFSSLICAGRSVENEQDRVSARQITLILAGLSTLALGLVGGWWMSRNATQSLQAMSVTASSISDKNLSQRVDVGGFDRELEQLGSVFNQMLDRLESSFAMQKQFTSDASHELRTPLAGLLTTIELALSRDREPEEYRRHLTSNLQSAQRMQRLVQSLLTLARLENATQTLELTEVNLQQVVSDAMTSCSSIATDAGVTLESTVPTALIPGNEVGLEQVFVNLIDNAIRYNRSGGFVRITLAEQTESRVVIEVEDSGLGISESDLPKVFDRFYRVDPSRSQNQQGCGLGLSIAKRIVELHRGSMGIRSELGKGTTISLSFSRLNQARE
jgi:two-component system, OmpR family, sensor kinase